MNASNKNHEVTQITNRIIFLVIAIGQTSFAYIINELIFLPQLIGDIL